MSSTSLEGLIPELREPARALIDVAQRAGVQPRVTSTLRTATQQDRLYRRFLAGASKFPAAPPGSSSHEYGYAFDLLVLGDDNQADLGSVWESWGGIWGSTRDPVHFEYPGFTPPRQERVTVSVPQEGGPFYALADFLSGWVPYLGEAQLLDWIFRLLHGQETEAEWYLQHPAEAIRDLVGAIVG